MDFAYHKACFICQEKKLTYQKHSLKYEVDDFTYQEVILPTEKFEFTWRGRVSTVRKKLPNMINKSTGKKFTY